MVLIENIKRYIVERKTSIILYFLLFFVVSTFLFFFIKNLQKFEERDVSNTFYEILTKTSICGNGICEKEENCKNCPTDCKCKNYEYCNEEGKCITPICGNGICELFESSENCCIDCGCSNLALYCDKTEVKCKTKTVNISDEKVLQLVHEYYRNKGEKIIEIKIIDTVYFKGKLGKMVKVIIEKEEFERRVIVFEDEEIIELFRP